MPEAPFGGQFGGVNRVLADAIAEHAFPGCAFGVLSAGEVIHQGALGRFTYEEDSRPVLVETVFDVASVTKVVATTAAAMLLHQRGRLELEIPLGELVPAFVSGRAVGDRARSVTLRHLLAHSSGLPGYVDFFRTAKTPEELLRACLQLPIEAEPGTRAEYSDPGFILLGMALEAVIGQDLAIWVRREVIEQLRLSATGFRPAVEQRPSIPPTEEDKTFRHRRIQGEVQDENAWVLNGASGHAGLFSNVPDLLRFAGELLNAGREPGSLGGRQTLFDLATVDLFAKRQGPESSSRALGWDTPSENSTSGRYFLPGSIGHLGFSGCSLWIDRAAGVAAVLLTNRTWPDRQSRLIRQVWPAFHDALRETI
jgi:CubicO group peptidase (beta-lactamase class C family)